MSLLDRGNKAILSIGIEEDGKYHGALSCEEVIEIIDKLVSELPSILREVPVDVNFR